VRPVLEAVGAGAPTPRGTSFFPSGRRRRRGAQPEGEGAGAVDLVVATAAISAWLGWTLLLLPPQMVAFGLDLPLALRIPQLYHRGVCRIFGLAVETRGEISAVRPVLFAANHCTYFDIPVLGSLLQASFVAKDEIRGWPLLGLLARMQGSVFISRRVVDTRSARDEMARRLHGGTSLILFPEGTTDDGHRLLPFRSALFSLAARELSGSRLQVQPVTIAYTRLNGIPIGYANRARIAWFGEMGLARHFLHAIRGGRITVVVHFHPPVAAGRFKSRRALARHCFEQISKGLEDALRGGARSAAA
jgi:1-acyl-sn-glycerol-3-phosphate acyltransferase